MKLFNAVHYSSFPGHTVVIKFLRYYLRNHLHCSYTKTEMFTHHCCFPGVSPPVYEGEWLWHDHDLHGSSWASSLCPFFVESFHFICKYHYLKKINCCLGIEISLRDQLIFIFHRLSGLTSDHVFPRKFWSQEIILILLWKVISVCFTTFCQLSWRRRAQ